MSDPVHAPAHYTGVVLPDGHPVECRHVIEALGLGFYLGCAQKYLWRYRAKGTPIQALEKARRYIAFEIERLKREGP